MATRTSAVLILGLALLLVGTLAAQQKPEDIPDAPSATRPYHRPKPLVRGRKPTTTFNAIRPRWIIRGGRTTGSKELPHSAPDIVLRQVGNTTADASRKDRAAGSVPKDLDTGEELYKYRATTTLVLVPVTVKDSNGHLVGGLLPKDFSSWKMDRGRP